MPPLSHTSTSPPEDRGRDSFWFLPHTVAEVAERSEVGRGSPPVSCQPETEVSTANGTYPLIPMRSFDAHSWSRYALASSAVVRIGISGSVLMIVRP